MTGGRKMTPITVALKGAAALKEDAKIEGKSLNRNIIRSYSTILAQGEFHNPSPD